MIPSIKTPRLELVSLAPEFLRVSLSGSPANAAILLAADLPSDWPKGHESLLQRRLTQLEADPSDQPWLLRGIVLRTQVPRLIGLIGFHAPPDSTGMVEIGYRIEPPYRGHGYATEAVEALLFWASQNVTRFRASISPDNLISRRIVQKLGFEPTGQQWDEVDGLELVFERDARTPRPYTPVDTT